MALRAIGRSVGRVDESETGSAKLLVPFSRASSVASGRAPSARRPSSRVAGSGRPPRSATPRLTSTCFSAAWRGKRSIVGPQLGKARRHARPSARERRRRRAPGTPSRAPGASLASEARRHSAGSTGRRVERSQRRERPAGRAPPARKRPRPGTRERAAGIEPAWLAWKARALPLSYARADVCHDSHRGRDPVELLASRAVRHRRARGCLRDRRTR